MTKIPPDDILEGLYKLRIRESEKLKTVLALYDLEIYQKKAGPDYHRLKTMVKKKYRARFTKQEFGARNGNYESNAVVKNQGTKQRGQRTLGDCWQWEANGQCSKGDNCSFRHDVNKRAKMTQPNPSPNSFVQQSERNASRTRSPSGRMCRWPCKDYLKGTCTNSLWKVAPSRMLVLQDKEWLQIWGKVLLCASPGWWTAKQTVQKEWWQKCSSHAEEEWASPQNRATCCERLLIKYTTIGLRLSGCGAAEVAINLTEELRHAETNPTCKIHESYCTSHQNSRPKSFARIDLPRWAPSA